MIAARLYMELLYVAPVLFFILLVNNFFLYKQKINNPISFMLFFGLISGISEILWTVVDRHPNMKAAAYIFTAGYCISLVVLSVFLNKYLIERFGLKLQKKWIVIAYILPVAVITVLSVTTPWTRLMFWVDESGYIDTQILFDTLYYYLVYIYIFSPLIIAAFFLTVGRKKRPKNFEIPPSLVVFGFMAPALFWFQQYILGEELVDYETTSLPISIALVYLVTNISTKAVMDTQAKMEAVEADLRIASKIQNDALPDVAPEFVDHLELNLRACMNTAKDVGGDFYDYFPIDDNRLCFLIADVSGKGTPAALFMMTAKTMIKDYALTRESTSEIFTAVNARLCENNDEGMFATAWIGIIDTRTMTLQFTNAGHNYPYIKHKDKSCEMIEKKHGLFLAGMDFTQYSHTEMQLAPGDRILLYTDGVVEAHNKENELYGQERLEKMIDSTGDLSGENVVGGILDDVNAFAAGVPQFDDITMLVLTIKDRC